MQEVKCVTTHGVGMCCSLAMPGVSLIMTPTTARCGRRVALASPAQHRAPVVAFVVDAEAELHVLGSRSDSVPRP
jgi:hypothetical protein